MARSTLPIFPLLVFGVIEPILLIWAYIAGMRDPHEYFAKQVPGASPSTTAFSAQAEGVTLQLVNALLLLAPMAVVCCFSRDPATAKGYLFAVALADYGHIYATYRAVGAEVFFHTSLWNDMVWGGVAVSGALNVLRWLTLFGAFGRVAAAVGDAGKTKRL
ncbi:hypothetical protein C8A03DRAFT_14565 [Achaetomium macrosporum]|uniref:DUF7704 domain-containing protein n=1 Tax=Achaetomium macrosporum TaxID=79813 RepID=A0AAN7CBI1_9PEZI|nr:hypothetical protein C8A03DRAFT_14565 [Achaetomium macrosporum]